MLFRTKLFGGKHFLGALFGHEVVFEPPSYVVVFPVAMCRRIEARAEVLRDWIRSVKIKG